MEGKALDIVGTRHLDRSHCPALLPHSIFQLECFLLDKKGARAGGESSSEEGVFLCNSLQRFLQVEFAALSFLRQEMGFFVSQILRQQTKRKREK